MNQIDMVGAYNRFNLLSRSIARDLLRHYDPYVDLEELHDLAVDWFFDPRNHVLVETWAEMPADRLLPRAIKSRMTSHAEVAKARQSGYEAADVAWYRAGQVRDLLDVWLGGGAPQATAEAGTRGAKTDPAFGGTMQASLADVGWAYGKLASRDRAMLRICFEFRYDWTALGALFAKGPMDVKRSFETIIKQLHDELGGPMPEGHVEFMEAAS